MALEPSPYHLRVAAGSVTTTLSLVFRKYEPIEEPLAKLRSVLVEGSYLRNETRAVVQRQARAGKIGNAGTMQMRPPVLRSTADESLSVLHMPIGQGRCAGTRTRRRALSIV